MTAPPCCYQIVTAANPGAVGIIQLHGPGAIDVTEQLTGKRADQRCRLVSFADIDEGILVALRDDWVQLMPHGGPRVMQRLTEGLRELGCTRAEQIDPMQTYPEAADEIEALMLESLARAASPAAIDRLLAQPDIWRAVPDRDAVDVQATAPLDHLITPPSIVLVGGTNVGKSTLTNFVTGRATSITADLPGTTRDWVGGLAMLPTPIGELCVNWFDTPGIRKSDDPIEQRAIELARQLIETADVLIAVRDHRQDWPDPADLPRRPDLLVINKADLPASQQSTISNQQSAIPTIATTGQGIDALATAIADHLGLLAVPADQPWAFHPDLAETAHES